MSRQKWAEARAPTLKEFEELAEAAWRQIPDEFRQLAKDVLIRIEDFATDDVLDSLGIENEFDLMGLYQGVSLERKSVMDIAQGPDTVVLYRRPILEYWADSDETLGALVTHVLVHEIGHHFGLSDADMEAIEAKAG
ncbi:MAG: metallopeptidase family protein [Hyphomicrobium sp.]|uniref:metallopeptidase family protein n=1 Tax=Hyphomicrobium sp. CS1BSMeth3 TaxID=1892844 RepID=UPI0009301280|nr:metallopeptidase family protein [Hyphomicrobium sp. CS1BSMeth3]MBN9261265.1 metallopeptidase family protein [Hyphomicrobium sp.]MBN9264104.1 metallopeptidase family protein [Hyphomicrobium sp.]MBN9277168.1 metallopeptidase family protein [Hyphomicrobium sp.]